MLIKKHLRGILAYSELLLAVIAAALWYRQGGAIWNTGSGPGPWPLVLLGMMWVFYWIRTGFHFRPGWTDGFLSLFVFSAWIGTQTAYDPAPAWAKFWLVVGAWGLFYAFMHQPDLKHIYSVLALCGLFGVALTTYFFLTNEWWTTHPIKIPALVALSEAISAFMPRLSTHAISPNVTGGMLATVFPFYVPLIALTKTDTAIIPLHERWLRLLRFFWWLAAGWSLFGLLVTTSRGAWLATLAGFVLWGLWRGTGWWCQRKPQTRTWTTRLWVMTGIIVLVAAAGMGTIALIIIRGLPGAAALTNRLTMWQDSLYLARDASLTGLGLGTYLMNFSIYTLLIHVGYLFSSHNFYLDLLIEQGILGLTTYLGLVTVIVVVGLRRLQRVTTTTQLQIEAGLVSLAVTLAHGLVDDILYGSRGLLLLFIPLAIILNSPHNGETTSPSSTFSSRRTVISLTAVSAAAVVLLALNWSSLAASFYASLGSVNQAKVELASYDPERFSKRPMDIVRQEENLDMAIRNFEQALAWNPGNLTARQRLASIDLSRGNYENALAHMEVAWYAGHRDAVTRLLYGDALLAEGQIELAANVIDGLTWAKVHLGGQAWYRYWQHKDWTRAAYAWRTLALLDPDDARALEYAAAAEARDKQ